MKIGGAEGGGVDLSEILTSQKKILIMVMYKLGGGSDANDIFFVKIYEIKIQSETKSDL